MTRRFRGVRVWVIPASTLYAAAMVGGQYLVATAETLRGLEILAFLLLIPLPSIALGLSIAREWALAVPIVSGTAGLFLVPEVIDVFDEEVVDGMLGVGLVLVGAGGFLAVWVGLFLRATVFRSPR